MKHTLLIGGLVIIVIGGWVYFMVGAKPKTLTTTEPQDITTIEESELPSEVVGDVEPFLESAPDISELQAGGSSYRHPAGVYTFLYPNDYSIDAREDGSVTGLYKRAETERGQSEITDGVLVVFETIPLEGKSLEEAVDARIEAMNSGEVNTLKSPKKAVLLNDYFGFSYATEGFGSATHVVIQKDPNADQAVAISFSVNDPQQNNYQAEVDRILATVEL